MYQTITHSNGKRYDIVINYQKQHIDFSLGKNYPRYCLLTRNPGLLWFERFRMINVGKPINDSFHILLGKLTAQRLKYKTQVPGSDCRFWLLKYPCTNYIMTSSNGNISALLTLCEVNHRWPVDSPHKKQWCGALVFSLISAWTNDWANNPDAVDLKRHRTHFDVGA